MYPPWNPPMSEVHHGMPERPMLSPPATWRRSESQVDGMSADQTAVPYRWLPTHAERLRTSGAVSPSAVSPSWNAREWHSGYSPATSRPLPRW